MVRLALHSIAYEAKTLNLAKEGFTAYYVDGTDGLDTHDGGSWAQAFKTIQHAVDEADSWCKIFIKAGTYAENITIAKQAIQIIGEKEDTVIISPPTGDAMIVSSNDCILSGCKFLVSENAKKGVHVTGDYNTVKNCIVGAGAAVTALRGCYISGDNNVVDDVTGIFYTGTSGTAIKLYGGYNEVKNCFVDDTNSWTYGIECAGGDYNSVHDNTVRGCSTQGINVYIGVSVATVFHNNLIGNTAQMYNAGTVFAFENFFDDHTTDSDNDGLCDTVYAFTGGNDYRPVSHFDGWKQTSVGIDPWGGVGIKKGVERTIVFKMVDATDFATPKTGITVTEERSLDGGAFAACTNAFAEIANGWYKITLTATEMNANEIIFKGTGAGCAQCDRLIVTES